MQCALFSINGNTEENRKLKDNRLHCSVIQKWQSNKISYAFFMPSPVAAHLPPPSSQPTLISFYCRFSALSQRCLQFITTQRYHSPYKSHTNHIWHCHSANVLRIIQFVAPSAHMCPTSIHHPKYSTLRVFLRVAPVPVCVRVISRDKTNSNNI